MTRHLRTCIQNTYMHTKHMHASIRKYTHAYPFRQCMRACVHIDRQTDRQTDTCEHTYKCIQTCMYFDERDVSWICLYNKDPKQICRRYVRLHMFHCMLKLHASLHVFHCIFHARDELRRTFHAPPAR